MARWASKLALGVDVASLSATSEAGRTADLASRASDGASTNYDQSANRQSPLTQSTAKNVRTSQQVWN